MEEQIEFCWIGINVSSFDDVKKSHQESLEMSEISLGDLLKSLFFCSRQLLKKYYSRHQLSQKIYPRQKILLPINIVNHQKINPRYSGPYMDILFENDHFLAIHKPPEIHSHPHHYTDQNTVLNFLCSQNIFAPLVINTESLDRGLLYRLDYETSGVLFLAKNQNSFDQVRSYFGLKVKEKWYLAIVRGYFDKEGSWTHYLIPSEKKGRKQLVFNDSTSHKVKMNKEKIKPSQLEVKRVLCHQNHSLILVRLYTGHRHQIRAQLSFLGYPLLGDQLYGGEKSSRIFLHAFVYHLENLVEVIDDNAELFSLFFDLNSALKVGHDMIRRSQSR